VGVVDWVTKRWLFEQFIAEQKLDWDDPWLKSLDLEFHHVSPGRSLALPLDKVEAGWSPVAEEVIQALQAAPGNTRAGLRSRLMWELSQRNLRYYVDWEVLDAAGAKTLELSNPFEVSSEASAVWLKALENPGDARSP